MSDRIQDLQSSPPVTDEDLMRLEVEPRLIPFIVATTQRVEQSLDGELQLTSAEAENLVEILDRVVSSNTANPGLKNRCFKVLRKVSSAYEILPKSYHLADVTLCYNPYASGGFTDIWKGQLDGHRVAVKTFRTQTATDLAKIKRRFYRDIIGWKYVLHPNVVPFYGISETLFSFCIINPWLSNGNILEYTRKNQRVNRLQPLAQATCGLKHLHSLGVMHGDINPGNILIDEDGSARLGDFGITAVITDPSNVDPGSTTTSKPGVVRYVAPELLNPSQFNINNSNPTKASDIYSLAMTAYEVLTDIVPFGNVLDSIITIKILTNNRPLRPQNARWLGDQTWDMITKCWSERREERWDIQTVYDRPSASSTQWIAEGQREAKRTVPNSNAVQDPHPLPRQNMTGEQSSTFAKDQGS